MLRKAVSIVMLIVLLLSALPLVFAAKFNLGDTVEVFNTGASGLVVRDSPAGNSIGKKYDGSRGMILAGPQSASYGGVVYNWWKVRWGDDALEGWSAEGYPGGVDYLRKVSISPSTKFALGDYVKVYNMGGSSLVVRTDPPALSYKDSEVEGTFGKVEGGPFYGVAAGNAGFYHFWKVNYGSVVGWSAENWLMKATPSDLTVEDIWIEPASFYPGDTVTIYTRIKNIGSSAAVSDQGLWIKALFDSNPCYQEGIEGLGSGYAYTFQWSYTWPSNTNSHTIQVTVDPNYYIVESSETNNVCSESFAANSPPINNPPFTPSNPSPLNHAPPPPVPITADLGWSGGDPDVDDTVTYDVYFGLSSSPPLVSSGQSATTYDPGTLSYGTTYYWKIVAKDNHGASTAGAVWDFTTTSINQPFTLNNGYVSPSSGDTSTTFSYYVTYSDPEGDVPTLKYVYIDGSPYAMVKISGDYVSGAVFKYSTTLSAGTHNFYFYFEDSVHGHTVRLPTSGTYSGPNVSLPPAPDFSISASPTSLSIQQGSSDSSTITITSINGFNQPVQLSVSGAPSGVTATLSPSQVTPPAGGTATSTLTVSVATTATPGSYTLNVTGTNGTLTHSKYISLEVTTLPIYGPRLSIPVYAPTYQEAHKGTIVTFIFRVTNDGTVTDTIELSVSDKHNWNIQLSKSSVTLEPSQSTKAYLNLTTGDYGSADTITIKGTSQGDTSKTSSCQVIAVSFAEGEGLLNVVLKFSNKDTQSHTLSFDVPDYVKLSTTEIFLNPSEEAMLYIAFDPTWYDIYSEPSLNSFSIHVVDFATAEGAMIPIKFDECVIISTDFDLTEDSYNFENGVYQTSTCYGMAATAILYFERVRATYELGKDEARDEILRYQGDVKNLELGAKLLATSPNEEAEYKKLEESMKSWNDPMVLALHFGIKGLHAVVAYKVVEKGDKAYILCYDNERPYSDMSHLQAFNYATYDLTTHELYYYGGKCEFLVYEPTEDIISLPVPKGLSWFGQVVSWIKSGVNTMFDCPVNITITDQYGRVISDNGTNQIPNATFASTNETKYFCLPLEFTYNVSISAYDVGNFSLMIVRLIADSNASIDMYENVSVKFGTMATLEIIPHQMNQTMKIDNDGDGVIDELKSPSVSETIYIPLLSYTFSIVWGKETFIVSVESNSTVSNFAFNQPDKAISFNVTGLDGTIGFCNVTIPKALLYGEPWTVLIDALPTTYTLTENATHSMLYFTYTHTTHRIQIIGTWAIGPSPDTTAPLIDMPFQEPEPDEVMPDRTVTVFVNVTDMESGVKSVILSYTSNGGVIWINLTMLYNATVGLYQAVIPAFPSGTNICYKVIAYDNADNVAINDNAGQYYCYTVSPLVPPLSVSISPLSASILVGQSVTFTSTVSGGYTPYSYQWYLNGNPVSGATSNTWIFTPAAGGIYYVYLKVTDAKANTAQSDTARITVATVPVGGYSFPIQVQTKTEPIIPYIALIASLTAIFTKLRRKTKRKR